MSDCHALLNLKAADYSCVLANQHVSGCHTSLCFKTADDTCHWLTRWWVVAIPHCISRLVLTPVWHLQKVSGWLFCYITFLLITSVLCPSLIILTSDMLDCMCTPYFQTCLMVFIFGSSDCKCSSQVFLCKISLLYKIKHVMSLPTIKNVLSLFCCPLSSWPMIYISSTLSLVLARVLGIIIWCLVFHFIILRMYLTFTKSHHHYLQACHFFASLTLVTSISSSSSRDWLSGSKYWLENPTIPYSNFSRAFYWGICWLYHGHWYRFVYCCIC